MQAAFQLRFPSAVPILAPGPAQLASLSLPLIDNVPKWQSTAGPEGA